MSKQFTFEAIGTHFWIEIFDEISDEKLHTTKSRVELLCSNFNERYSRFRSDSLISILNRERKLKNPSHECLALLLYGKELYLRTQTTFNILTGHILEARGYDAGYSFVASKDADSLAACNPLTDLTISDSEVTLSCGNIDLGGYGKGWLIDILATDLLQKGVQYFLANGGGDMFATSNNNEPIEIYLEHPTEANTYLLKTTLLNQGFAASSPFRRRWKSGEKIYTHVIAPPNIPEIATFVKAKTAVDADAFATMSLLSTEETLSHTAKVEGIEIAYFNPSTNEFWKTNGFT